MICPAASPPIWVFISYNVDVVCNQLLERNTMAIIRTRVSISNNISYTHWKVEDISLIRIEPQRGSSHFPSRPWTAPQCHRCCLLMHHVPRVGILLCNSISWISSPFQCDSYYICNLETLFMWKLILMKKVYKKQIKVENGLIKRLGMWIQIMI